MTDDQLFAFLEGELQPPTKDLELWPNKIEPIDGVIPSDDIPQDADLFEVDTLPMDTLSLEGLF